MNISLPLRLRAARFHAPAVRSLDPEIRLPHVARPDFLRRETFSTLENLKKDIT